MLDVIIVGGGPAGVTAGIYTIRKKLNTLIISKDFVGQTGKALSVENWPGDKMILGAKLMKNFKDHLEKFNVNINEGEEVIKIRRRKDHFEVRTSERDRYLAKSIIVATGANPRLLAVPGEEEFIGKGVSYCATCDAPLFAGKTVAVVGGGNSGLDTTMALSQYAKKIYLLEFSDSLKGAEVTQEKIEKDKKVKVILETAVKEIKGKKFVESIICEDRKTKKQKEIKVDGMFVQIGNVPAVGFVKALVSFNKRNEIKIDPKTNSTRTPGVFAAGDVTSVPFKQIVIAAGEGAKAALSCYQWLNNKS